MALRRARSPVLRVCVLGAGLGLALASGASRVRAQAPRGLFSDELDARTAAPATAPNADAMVLRGRIASVNLTMLAAPGLSGPGAAPAVAARTVDLNLFSDVNLVAQLDRVETVASFGYAWVGSVIGVEASSVILAVSDGVLDAAIMTPQHSYSVIAQREGGYAIAEINRRAIQPDVERPAPARQAAAVAPFGRIATSTPVPPPTGAADSSDSFDLLLYYTTPVKNRFPTQAALNAFITASIAQVNSVHAASALPTRIRLVGAYETSYTESGDINIDGVRITNSLEFQATRDRLGADLMTLLVSSDPANSGTALTMPANAVIADYAPLANSVVVHYPAIGYIASLAHELGHNMGCMHEPGNNPGNGAFPYSQGFVDSVNKFWTVMAYGTTCQGACVPVDQFSSPVNLYQGHPVGTATQDNQRTIMNTRSIVANLHQSTIRTVGPPVNFSATASGSDITLNWGPPQVGAAASYIIEAGSQTGASNLTSFNTGSTATTFSTGGVPQGVYFIRAKAVNGGETSPASNEVILTVGACTGPPPFVTLLSFQGGPNHAVTLQWPASPGATDYILEAGTARGLSDLAVIDLGSAATVFRTTGVTPGTYYVQIRAKNACGTSPPGLSLQIVVVPQL